MILRGAFQVLALKLQEAVDSALGANDVRTRLGDCIRQNFRGSGTWGYYLDHFGDDASGDVIFSCDSEVRRAGYQIEPAVGGTAAKCTIDFEGAVCVVPRTIYELEPEEAAHYAAMEESLKTEKLYTALPVYERYIAKAERDGAEAGDFAGKGRSFPILKRGDVMAAVHSMGRAGEGNSKPAALKARIIAIAKRKGWTSSLPKSWRTETTPQESAPTPAPAAAGSLEIRESCAFAADIIIREALTASRKIKLIAPGKGSTAWYTEAALRKAATDKIFKAGTPMRIDHPTQAQEAERPEGSVRDWGAVLARDAEWIGDHSEGPGLYSEVKPFSDSAEFLDERAPYAGVSIRANGYAVMDGDRPVMREGVPLLREFSSAEGVDMVTRAGAGGMFLSEAAVPVANPTNEGEPAMDAAQLTALQESLKTQAASNARLLERAIRGDARELAQTILSPLTLHEAAKGEVISNLTKPGVSIPVTEAGELDAVKFTEAVNAEAKRIGALAAALTESGRPTGLGAPAPVVQIDAAETARRAAAATKTREAAVRNFREAFSMSPEAAEKAADRMLEGEVA